MTTHYKRFTKLIAKWPVDPTKGDRDLGKYIRETVRKAFELGSKTNWETEECQRQYTSLNRLADNKHRNRYRLTRNSNATGLSTDECKLILSTEVLAYLKEENKGLFKKIFNKD